MQKIICFVLFISLIMVVSACSENNITLKFNQIPDVSTMDDTVKILLVNGTNGEQTTIKDKEKIIKFYKIFNELKLTRVKNQEAIKGTEYFVTLEGESEKVYLALLGKTLKLNQDYYEINTLSYKSKLESLIKANSNKSN
ncbi:hypothetical protein ACIQD3_24420 [Peribacillus loiseleuriae]|uniref:hypothetical protein n=1 Tax=Peribacillus loiseleuriae TaxID=1679170 RepID=UPI0038272585